MRAETGPGVTTGPPVLRSLAVPFDERLLEIGVHRALALRLFEQRQASLARAARVAGVPPEEFMVLLGEAGIPAADYPPEELDDEVHVAS